MQGRGFVAEFPSLGVPSAGLLGVPQQQHPELGDPELMLRLEAMGDLYIK